MLMQARANFFGSSPASKVTPHQLRFRSTLHSLPNLSNASFTSQDIGGANADRVVIVAGYAAGDAALGLGCNVGGLTATNFSLSGTGTECMFGFYVLVSSGATATIQFTTSTILRILDAAYWTCLLPVGDSLFAQQASISSGSAVGATITIPANGFAISTCIERANAVDMGMSINQSFIERADEFAQNGNFAAADREVTQQMTDIGCTWALSAGTTKNGIVLASFGFTG